MPTISMFYGILVSMYALDTNRHYCRPIHDELMAEWLLASEGQTPFKIDPLC